MKSFKITSLAALIGALLVVLGLNANVSLGPVSASAGKHGKTCKKKTGAKRRKCQKVKPVPTQPAPVPVSPGTTTVDQPRPADPKPADQQTTDEVVPEVQEPTDEGYGAAEPYADGQCTRYAWRKRTDLPGNLGNANTWNERAQAQGFPVDGSPRAGDIAVWEAWTNGANTKFGHVAYVESVNANGTITVSEWNWIGPYKTSVRTISPGGLSFIHKKGPPPVQAPVFDDVRTYSSNTLEVTAGTQVRAVVTARYRGPVAIPCGHANLGVRGDVSALYADHAAGYWPNSPWRSPNRVAAVGCNGNLDPGEYAQWDLTFRPPVTVPNGTHLTGHYAPVHEGRAWSALDIPISVRVTPAAEFQGPSNEIQIPSGGSQTVQVSVRNRSNRTWARGKDNLHSVDTLGHDVTYPHCGSTPEWVNGNAVLMNEGSVAPGQVATYPVKVCGKAGYNGTATLHLQFVEEGVAHYAPIFDLRLRFS